GFRLNTPACPGTELRIIASAASKKGDRAAWQANAPAGIALVGAWIPSGQMFGIGINVGLGDGASFYWKGGQTSIQAGSTGWRSPQFSSPYFGWQVVCADQ